MQATVIFILPLLVMASPLHADKTPPKRVILIQADDLGYDDLGSSGNPLVETPNLDRLAAESVVGLDFTVNPVCAPSRATLLTGRHFLRTGVSHVHGGKDFLNPSETTLADVFSANGWRTAMWGKWHLGTLPGYYPWERGFETALRTQLYRHEDARGELNGEPLETSLWADEWIFGEAIRYLEAHPDEPAFLYLPTMTPHGPLRAPEALVQRYREKNLSEGLATLYAMITLLDQEVGRLLDFLDAQGMREDTLVIFTSDNGPAINDHELSDADRRIRKISARRGWKGDIWENGVRAPLFVRWPAGLQPGVVAAPLDQVDLFPTLLAWCGIEDFSTAFPLDGHDVREAFDVSRAENADPEATEAIFNYVHPGWITGRRPYDARGIPGEYNPVTPAEKATLRAADQSISMRRGRFKLIRNPFAPDEAGVAPQRWVLVDLFDDPGEAQDVSEAHPGVFASMKQDLEAWFDSVKAEENAFGAPVIRLVPDVEQMIPATRAAAMDARLQNSVPSVFGWNAVDQWVDYDLDVREDFDATVKLEWREVPSRETELLLLVGDSTTTAKIGEAGELLLEKVHFSAGQQRLRLKVLTPSRSVAQLQAIRVIPE